jgi:hypothetical protein
MGLSQSQTLLHLPPPAAAAAAAAAAWSVPELTAAQAEGAVGAGARARQPPP